MSDNSNYSFGTGDGYALGTQYGDWGQQNSDGSWQVPNMITDPSSAPGVLVPVFGSTPGTGSPLIQTDTPNVSVPGFTSSVGAPGSTSMMNAALGAGSDGSGLAGLGSALGEGSGALGGALGLAGGVGGLIGTYTNATTDTGTSVLSGVASGAASGAAIGSIVPGIGTAFGAVAGGIIGGLGGLFGSSSKKKQEKEAFQQAEQLAILPAQQQQANWLQQQGLTQKAISNYKSGYTPGGFNYTNGLLANNSKSPGYKTPGPATSLPNFNVAPASALQTGGNSSLGIQPGGPANNGINANAPQSGLGASGFVAPNSTVAFNPTAMPTAPGYTKDKTAQQQELNQYSTAYNQYLLDQNRQAAADAMNAYGAFA